MLAFTDFIEFNVTFTWQDSLGIQLETRGSRESLKSKCPLIFEAFNAHDKLLIGNGQGDADE